VTVPYAGVFSPPPILVFKIHFDVIKPSLPGSSMFSLSCRFYHKIWMCISWYHHAYHMFHPSRPFGSNRIDNTVRSESRCAPIKYVSQLKEPY
jgi:hypothetical protein